MNARLGSAARLRGWLLDGPVQMRDGPEAGGVAGILDEGFLADYVYGEITGYYLHWLGTIEAGPSVRERAATALAWCERRFGGDAALPPTRIYLDGRGDDWRNRAQFFFDLAIQVGGLATVARAGLVAPPAALLGRLCGELARFVCEGRILALRADAPDAPDELPRRWSTVGGAFEAKAASRVLLAAEFVDLPKALAAACHECVEHVAAGAADAPVEMLHPTLYAIEGALTAHTRHRAALAGWLSRLLALDNGRGELPESPEGPALLRSDVIAQALRVGVVLRAEDVPGAPSIEQLEGLATALVARVRDDGSIAFRPDAEAPQLNTWCAMFAEQALRWHASSSCAAPDPREIV